MSIIIMRVFPIDGETPVRGPAASDVWLQDIAEVVQVCLPPQGIVGRYDELKLCIALPFQGIDYAREVAEEIERVVDRHLAASFRITVCFGVASSEFDEDGWESIIAHAEQALDSIGTEDRDRVRCHLESSCVLRAAETSRFLVGSQ